MHDFSKLQESCPFIEKTHFYQLEERNILFLVVPPKKQSQQQKEISQVLETLGEHYPSINPVFVSKSELEFFTDELLFDDWLQQELQADHTNQRKVHERCCFKLREAKKLLRWYEQEFPFAGLQSLMLAKQLNELFQRLLSLAHILVHQSKPSTVLTQQEIEEKLCQNNQVFHQDVAQFPFLLKVYQDKHHYLSQTTTLFPADEREWEDFLIRLGKMTSQLEAYVKKHFTTPEMAQETRKQRFQWAALIAAPVLVVLAFFYWKNRPKQLHPIRNFQKANLAGGITGYYYRGRAFNRFVKRQTDSQIAKYWRGRPMPNMPENNFSIRWEGYLQAPNTGLYRLCYTHDDGGKLTIGKTLLVKDWRTGASRKNCKKLLLKRGWYPILASFYEAGQIAHAELTWKKPGDTKEHQIPSKRLCCKPKKPTTKKPTPKKRVPTKAPKKRLPSPIKTQPRPVTPKKVPPASPKVAPTTRNKP